MPSLSSLAAAAGLLLMLAGAGSAGAAGLGKAKVVSTAGEPLRVRIELILGPGDRPGRIRAAVASPAIADDDESNQLWVTVDPAPYGRAVLTVRSVAPVEAPSLELFVAVSSPAGRAQRSFDIPVPQPPPAAPAGDGTAPGPPAEPQGAPPPLAADPGLTPASGTQAVAPQDRPARLEDRAELGRQVSLIALGVAALAGLGALVLAAVHRRG
jgi:Tfp pilus assembly protein FimV